VSISYKKITSKGFESEYLTKKLRDYNSKAVGYNEPKPIGFVVYQDDQIIAGMFGFIKWGWLYLDIAWVKDEFRKTGLGKKLLEKMGHAALGAGVNKIRCETGSFQSLDFYLKNGFENYAQNEITAPNGSSHTEYLLRKTITSRIE
jgi:GNAT superfamily N-acetyltransferase